MAWTELKSVRRTFATTGQQSLESAITVASLIPAVVVFQIRNEGAASAFVIVENDVLGESDTAIEILPGVTRPTSELDWPITNFPQLRGLVGADCVVTPFYSLDTERRMCVDVLPAYIPDHAIQAVDNLTTPYGKSVNLKALLEILVEEVQNAEDMLYDLISCRLLSTARGVQLDQYGAVVGQKRLGLFDDEYRKLLGVRILANSSHGEAWRIIEIAARLLDVSVWYQQRGRAHFSLTWTVPIHTPQAWIDVFVDMINYAIPVGVSWEAIEGLDDDRVFRFDSGPGYDVGRLAKRIV